MALVKLSTGDNLKMPTSDNQEGNEEGKTSKVKLSSDQRILLVCCKSGVGLGQVEAKDGESIFVISSWVQGSALSVSLFKS